MICSTDIFALLLLLLFGLCHIGLERFSIHTDTIVVVCIQLLLLDELSHRLADGVLVTTRTLQFFNAIAKVSNVVL